MFVFQKRVAKVSKAVEKETVKTTVISLLLMSAELTK